MIEKNNKEELKKLLIENPDLPLVFGAMNDELIDGNLQTIYENYCVYVGEVYFIEIRNDDFKEVIFDDYEWIKEVYAEHLNDNDETTNMTDGEFERYVEDYIEDNVKHYKAIIVECRL